jgi:hypothetical protein
MRILRGLGSRTLACGCLAGIYETYDGQVVTIVDERGPSCYNPRHEPGHSLAQPERAAAVDRIKME